MCFVYFPQARGLGLKSVLEDAAGGVGAGAVFWLCNRPRGKQILKSLHYDEIRREINAGDKLKRKTRRLETLPTREREKREDGRGYRGVRDSKREINGNQATELRREIRRRNYGV